uniref:Uncharacterized protein n=1 Tax=Rhizophora mucronata TaxID=61149 RepID=A0A2P2P7A1_RHIMU
MLIKEHGKLAPQTLSISLAIHIKAFYTDKKLHK